MEKILGSADPLFSKRPGKLCCAASNTRGSICSPIFSSAENCNKNYWRLTMPL